MFLSYDLFLKMLYKDLMLGALLDGFVNFILHISGTAHCEASINAV